MTASASGHPENTSRDDDGAIFMLSADDTVLDMNSAGEALLGYTREALVGGPFGKVLAGGETRWSEVRAGSRSPGGRVDAIRLLSKTGETFVADLKVDRLNIQGQCVTCVQAQKNRSSLSHLESALRLSQEELEVSRTALKAEYDKLWKLAANTFSLLGEASLTEKGIQLTFFGDVPPEKKLGVAPDMVFSNVERVREAMHPDDVGPFTRSIEHSVATGDLFHIVYRLSDGQGGWRWLKVRACSLEERDGKHVRWLHDTADITEQKITEEALRKTVKELQHLEARLQKENVFLREEMTRSSDHVDLVGKSAVFNRVMEQVELVAATSSSVLISGETGTGKELVAAAIHRHSARHNRLFVAVNCAALPATLVESELFGHEKGSFTGALARRIGRFEQADQGTLFLDEVGELPMETQAKMLRVLQSGEFERVGGNRALHADVRVIAASNRDLEQAVREGRFRSDLYHRLAVFPIHLPPLRERPEDIAILTAYLVSRKALKLGRKIDSIPDTVMALLTAYDWPGNVRELENVLERAVILSPGTSLRPEAFQLGPAALSQTRSPRTSSGIAHDAGGHRTLQACEQAHILRVCQSTGWKIKGPGGAAEILQMNAGTLYSRMKKLGIRRPPPAREHLINR
jgi:transcriptional regulator with GAF, ATPase, and Fis domain